MQGIYKISDPSGGFYIGSSVNIERRFRQHKSELRRNCHTNFLLQSAYETHKENLKFEALSCVIDKKYLLELEQFFIDSLQPTYNLTMVAISAMLDPTVRERASEAVKRSAKHKQARLKNQTKAAKSISKKVIRMTDGVIFESGYAAAKFHNQKSKDNIGTAIKNGWKFAGHFWCYADDPKDIVTVESAWNEKEKLRKQSAALSSTNALSKKVVRLSDGAIFSSATEASRQLNYYRTMVSDAIRLNAVRAGSRWSYV